MSAKSLEKEYVHTVYSRLASYIQKKETGTNGHRIWPNVTKFLDTLPIGSCVIDIGCGEAKYHPTSCFVLGVDTCPDVLLAAGYRPNVQLLLGDALALPFKDNSADAVLFVSVLHHLSTPIRRRAAVAEAIRCLKLGGRLLICVWAYEQPNASFPSQDVLVPWRLHEQTINGRLPQVKFHVNSTKEQRIIENSIPVAVPSESSLCSSNWIGNLINRVQNLRTSLPFLPPREQVAPIPPAAPKLLGSPRVALLSGIRRWSPMLSRRLASLLVSIEEQLAEEMSHKIMEEAVTETMATLRNVTFYRYYHVFKKGELEEMCNGIVGAKVVSSTLEHANWSVVVEKVDESAFRA